MEWFSPDHVKEVFILSEPDKIKNLATWSFGKDDLKRTIPVHIVKALYYIQIPYFLK